MKNIVFALLLLSVYLNNYSQQYESGGKYDYLVTVNTRFGNIQFILFEDTPLHRENFLYLIDNKAFNGTLFHRVINNFMIQGGDINTRQEKLSDDIKKYTNDRIPAEIRPNHLHIRGAVAAARQGDQINPYRMSSASQFYIVQNPNGTPHLNGAYTVFGFVVSGMEVVDKIVIQQTGAANKPVEDIRMDVSYKKILKSEITKLYNYIY